MLPNNSWSSEAVPAALVPPHDKPPALRTVARDAGPVALGDVTQGLLARIWAATWSQIGGEIRMDDGTLLATVPALDWLGLTFDQSGRYFLTWHNAGAVFIRWYDSSAGQVVTTEIAAGDQPFCYLDERRPELVETSDVLLLYRRGNSAFLRRQRDRFLIEYVTPVSGITGLSLDAFAMNVIGRMQINQLTPKGAAGASGAEQVAGGSAAAARPPVGIGTGA